MDVSLQALLGVTLPSSEVVIDDVSDHFFTESAPFLAAILSCLIGFLILRRFVNN